MVSGALHHTSPDREYKRMSDSASLAFRGHDSGGKRGGRRAMDVEPLWYGSKRVPQLVAHSMVVPIGCII